MFFGRKKEKKETVALNWQPLRNTTDLEAMKVASLEKPAVVFKHSTSCSISSAALGRFERNWQPETEANIYFLDILSNRALSNQIAQDYSVIHQSPQVLVIKNGESVHDASHFDIAVDEITKHL